VLINRRIFIDLDRSGNAIGSNVEFWQDGECYESLHYLPEPFDNPHDVLAVLLDECPAQGVLFNQ
jgi:hypothetical protein